jgi:RecB family endonuclease NucS
VLQRGFVRLVVARCSVEYEGRLGARLPPAQRLILLKADGSVAIHADAKAYKPLNWMSPPVHDPRRGSLDRGHECRG